MAKSTRNKIYSHMSLIVLSSLAYSSQTVNVRKMGMGLFKRTFCENFIEKLRLLMKFEHSL